MKRIIWHWSAGGNKANGTDRRAYHIIIEGDGKVVKGNSPISANARISNPRDTSTYAAHTGGLNTGSIGVSLAGMRGAQESPFRAGPSPITQAQVDALIRVTADLCREYGIPVTDKTVLSHAEVEPRLGVKQRPRWDIAWLPGMTRAGDPMAIGDGLRDRVRDAMRARPVTSRPVADSPAPKTESNGLGALIRRLLAWLGGRA